MDEDAYEDAELEIAPTRWHWSFLVMRTLCFGANMANAARCYLGEVAQDVASYANYQMEKDERNDFRAEAGREIDALLTQED